MAPKTRQKSQKNTKDVKATRRPSTQRKPQVKADVRDYRFVLSEQGDFLFISPDLIELWDVKMDGEGASFSNSDGGRGLVPQDIIVFADHDEVFDDRIYFKAGPNGRIFDLDEDDGLSPDAQEDLWVKSIRDGCHTMICGEGKKIVDFQCDWVSAKGISYLIGSGPASPNIPQAEDKMQKMLHQILESREEEKSKLATQSQTRPEPPVSARLKTEEVNHFTDMSRDLMCTTHLDGSLIRFNRSFEEILGYKPENLIGKSFMDFVFDDDRSVVRNAFYGLGYTEEANEDARDIDVEARMKRSDSKDGGFRWVHWQVRKEKGNFYCLGKDITDVKAHEEQLERRRSELVEAQSLARMGHWRWDVGADRIEWSEQLYHVFGVKKEDFVTTMDNVNTLIHRRDIGKLFQAFQRAIIQQNDYDMDFRIKRPDGEERYIRCEGRCDIDHEGDVIALFGIMQDVTEQMRHQEELKRAKDSAEAAYASKSRFLANMSHELRTPLNAIIGFSEMMEHQLLGPLGNKKYLDYVSGIRESGQHLLDLISDILDMSKIEAGKYELDIEEVNVSKAISLSLHMMEGRAQESGVSLRMGPSLEQRGEENSPIIHADRRALMQILLNLLSNSVKFTPEGGVVTADCVEKTSGLEITISDTGVGIPANKLANVLMPFEQAAHEHTRDHEGSGLGLSITKELTELHGGHIKISSEIGKGTTVKIMLPYTANLGKDG